MKDATTYYIGDYHKTQTDGRAEVVPTVGRVRGVDGAAKGRKRNPKGQTQASTTNHAANGFLRTSFLPKLQQAETIQPCRKTAKTERDFYESLSQLAQHYDITPMHAEGYGYPYNVALSLWDTQRKLKQKGGHFFSLALLQDRNKTVCVSEERYRTGASLYYIPVMPLYKMFKDPKRKVAAQLLLSVCAYLYHIADIPYFRQEDSYLYYQYELIKEWVEQDEEAGLAAPYMEEIKETEKVGDSIEQKLLKKENLRLFKKRLDDFTCRDEFDRECLEVALECFALYTDYPNDNIFRNAAPVDEDSDEYDYDSGTVRMDQYISFYAGDQSWLYENLSDSVNSDFNECLYVQEPVIVKQFDGSVVSGSLDFECRLFSAIDDLCHLLYNYKD